MPLLVRRRWDIFLIDYTIYDDSILQLKALISSEVTVVRRNAAARYMKTLIISTYPLDQ